MSTFDFNKVFILESLKADELHIGAELERRLNEWIHNQGIKCQVVTFQVHSIQEWEFVWSEIFTRITEMGNKPIIHLEMHSNNASLEIDGGSNGFIPFCEVLEKVQHANILSKNNIFLSWTGGIDLKVIRGLNVFEPMPFCGVLGFQGTLQKCELLDNYTIFYSAFLKTLSLDKAEQALKEAGIDADKYELHRPEQLFINAYLGYLETYKTDEQIIEKAIHAAKKEDIQFKNEDEKKRFIRDYRCTLLLRESIDYQKALKAFFILDRYPANLGKYDIPKDVYEFKQLVGKNGHSWLLENRHLSDDDVKGLSLKILENVDTFCKRNEIKYSVAYGTMIGAIRHKGFIPWDDDIDIMMIRSDYEKFIRLYNLERDNLFSVASFETDKRFHYLMAKIVCNSTINDELGYTGCGFAIDLFPIDKLTSNGNELKRILRIKKQTWNWFSLKTVRWNNNRGVLKNILLLSAKFITHFIPDAIIRNRIYRVIRKYSTLDEDYCLGCLFTPYGARDIMSSAIYSGTIEVPFEQNHFSCIKEFDKYLSNVYGDYMKYPPIEKQVTHHDFIAYWK